MWHREPVVIASSHLLRRRNRAAVLLLQEAEPWDLVVLDEAHHARRRAAGSAREGGANALLRLMRELKERTEGLVLLTATPMQVHPVEVWDLLNLLGLAGGVDRRCVSWLLRRSRAAEPGAGPVGPYGAVVPGDGTRIWGRRCGRMLARLTGLSPLKTNKVLRALRDEAGIPRRRLENGRAACGSRHIACAYADPPPDLAAYARRFCAATSKPGRCRRRSHNGKVDDRFIELTEDERNLYAAVEAYIASTYNQAAAAERSAVGFVMTIYRRRLASSFRALCATPRAASGGDLEREPGAPVRPRRRRARRRNGRRMVGGGRNRGARTAGTGRRGTGRH